MDAIVTTGSGVGQRVPRKEDDRYLRGKGEFIADIRLAGMRELAFVRSPLAHARIITIAKPEHDVFTAADLTNVRPIVANSALPGFKPSAQPPLATDKCTPRGRSRRSLRRRHPRRRRRPRRTGRRNLPGITRHHRHARRSSTRRAARPRHLGRQRLPGNPRRIRPVRHPRHRRHNRPPPSPHRPSMHVPWKAEASSPSGTAASNN